jgi:hypothetical protein
MRIDKLKKLKNTLDDDAINQIHNWNASGK